MKHTQKLFPIDETKSLLHNIGVDKLFKKKKIEWHKKRTTKPITPVGKPDEKNL